MIRVVVCRDGKTNYNTEWAGSGMQLAYFLFCKMAKQNFQVCVTHGYGTDLDKNCKHVLCNIT